MMKLGVPSFTKNLLRQEEEKTEVKAQPQDDQYSDVLYPAQPYWTADKPVTGPQSKSQFKQHFPPLRLLTRQ